MQCVILAGGKGSRLSEETTTKPKPMVEAGGKPLLWHVMQSFSRYGITDFIILSGYKGEVIKNYFKDFFLLNSDVKFDLGRGSYEVLKEPSAKWNVTILDTGLESETGERILRAQKLLGENFFITYGDCVGDVDITGLLNKHTENASVLTLTAVRPPARFGAVEFPNDASPRITFKEKPIISANWINGGYMAANRKIFDYLLSGDSFEFNTIPRISDSPDGFGLTGYRHFGFWQPVDTLRDLQSLEHAIENKVLPWL